MIISQLHNLSTIAEYSPQESTVARLDSSLAYGPQGKGQGSLVMRLASVGYILQYLNWFISQDN